MEKYKDILDKAYEAMDNAYAPYSNFHVGACVKTKNGKYFIGANIENASYGLTNCAERNAIFQTYSQGYRQDDIEALAIVGQGNTLITPCGACRQVLVELLKRDTPIVLGTGEKVLVTNIEELMPMAFTNEAL
ncbi:cytidine deaminase [uncultured Fusobacterium sp.]|uniref:cytidine deaminase n=1 Tax=uncultured Fusobacterium sp. TaxID=159267 RepID=UPI0015A5C7A2|nr:cytidine deaminase [uncultured Fusobacterium sp.]